MISRILKYYLSFATIIVLSFFQVSLAQEVQVRSALERDTILIGDQILYRIDVAQPQNINISFPSFKDTITGHIEIIRTIERDTTLIQDDFIQVRQDYLITSFDSGFYEIPSQKLNILEENNKIDIFTDPAYLRVLTMPLDTTQAIFDIKLPYGEPITLAEVLPYILAFLLLAVGIFFLIRFIRNLRNKRRGIVRKKPSEPAHIVALRELDKLKADKLWQNNKVKGYYTRLTDIIRSYLEGRFDVHAMEHTSDEILEELKQSGFNDNRLFKKLKDTLIMSDLVKFAKLKPLPQDNETCILDAYIFINETKPVEKLEAEKDSGESSDNGTSEEKAIKIGNKEIK